MTPVLILIFVTAYLAIACEHIIKTNKAVPALFAGVLMWTIWSFTTDHEQVAQALEHHFYDIAQILFFLLGAMTIVQLVDAHQGFKIVTNRITTVNARLLMWIICLVTFFLSAALDNLTTAIVIGSLLRRLIHSDKQRMMFIGMVIIAANAGGAWSPIGDVTTTMLWIGGQITAPSIIASAFFPSLIALLIPLCLITLKIRGKVHREAYDHKQAKAVEDVQGSKLMFFTGVGVLLFVPIFKMVTHLPPFLGMMFGLAIVWGLSELIHIDKTEEEKKPYTALYALSRIDTSAILFFLGILLAVSSLQSSGILTYLAEALDRSVGNLDSIAVIVGLLSSVIDNVPMVAAVQQMYDFPTDARLWSFVAYTAGTGGSCLIIGSAAGVALMGSEKIDFFWYLKNIAGLAFLGYICGALFYIVSV